MSKILKKLNQSKSNESKFNKFQTVAMDQKQQTAIKGGFGIEDFWVG